MKRTFVDRDSKSKTLHRICCKLFEYLDQVDEVYPSLMVNLVSFRKSTCRGTGPSRDSALKSE